MIEKLIIGSLVVIGLALIIYSLYDSSVNDVLISKTEIISGGISLGLGLQIHTLRKKRLGHGSS